MNQEAVLGLTTWMRMVLEQEPLDPFVEYLLDRANADEADVSALIDLSLVAQLQGQTDWGVALQLEALKKQQIFPIGGEGHPDALSILGLMMPGKINDNIALDCLLAPFDVKVTVAYVGEDVPWMGDMPPHSALVNCIANRSMYGDYLKGIAELISQWPFPVINAPYQVLKVMPETLPATCETMLSVQYCGDDLQKLVATLPVVRASEFIPHYRLFIVGEKVYVFTVALHESAQTLGQGYYQTDALNNTTKQQVEQNLFGQFESDFIPQYQEPLKELTQGFGLDFVCIDCIPLADGKLALTKVDTATLVHNIESLGPKYHTEAHFKIMQAFYQLLRQKSR